MSGRTRTTLALALSSLLLLAGNASAQTVADEVGTVDSAVGAKLRAVERLVELTPHAAPQLAPPLDPIGALTNEISRLSAALGFPQDPALAVASSGIPPDLAGRLANVLGRMFDCNAVTKAHFDRLGGAGAPWQDIATTGGGLDAAQFADVTACADALWTPVADLEWALAMKIQAGGVSVDVDACVTVGDARLDVWPVIRVDTSCRATTYANDYLLLVDTGGNDVYANNVGSNMVDLKRGPVASLAIETGPAIGCQLAIGAPGRGGIANGDCVPTAALLLDMQGADTYGVKEAPDVDAVCTADPVVRRMVIGGVGFLGVGILLDGDPKGNDAYTGKQVSLGSGHIFGVGLLVDRGGNDQYSAVRNSQGFSLVGHLGVLRDEGGNDRYDFYIPAPLDPSAPDGTNGAGGVIDDTGVCDRAPRFVQGAANVGGIGVLVDESGHDTYVGAEVDGFGAPGNDNRAGSQGFAQNGATGVLLDRRGSDTYSGTTGRGNGVTMGPDDPRTGFNPPDGSFGSPARSGAGVFIDRA